MIYNFQVSPYLFSSIISSNDDSNYFKEHTSKCSINVDAPADVYFYSYAEAEKWVWTTGSIQNHKIDYELFCSCK